MRVPAQALSNSILRRSFSEKIQITPMKLQKLIYFTYRDYLKNNNDPLISAEFEVWKYGPVLSGIYDEFKSFGANPITRFARNADGSVSAVNEDAFPRVSKSIDSVWNKYKNYDGITLSAVTHKPGSAWYVAYQKHNAVLSNEDILHDDTDVN